MLTESLEKLRLKSFYEFFSWASLCVDFQNLLKILLHVLRFWSKVFLKNSNVLVHWFMNAIFRCRSHHAKTLRSRFSVQLVKIYSLTVRVWFEEKWKSYFKTVFREQLSIIDAVTDIAVVYFATNRNDEDYSVAGCGCALHRWVTVFFVYFLLIFCSLQQFCMFVWSWIKRKIQEKI